MKQRLIDYWQAAANAAQGQSAVYNAMQKAEINEADAIIAVGKAAASMALGALKAIQADNPQKLERLETLIITKYGHGAEGLDGFANLTLLEAGHPLPDENSLSAGSALLNKVKSLGKNCKLIFLVSGGASSLVEHLRYGLTLFDLQTLNMRMIANGLPIAEMNKMRRKYSQLKYGKLLSQFNGAKLDIFYISDVEGDELSVIGSGIGYYNQDLHVLSAEKPDVSDYLVASNAQARDAIASKAHYDGIAVIINEECLYDDVFILAPKIANRVINGDKGLYIFGGEPTIKLPPNPKNGGRNQSLALAIAKQIYRHENIEFIIAGTDGTDGPTEAAGAIVDGTSFRHADAANDALEQANAGDYLQNIGALYTCGPTGTNVMDIIIGIKY